MLCFLISTITVILTVKFPPENKIENFCPNGRQIRVWVTVSDIVDEIIYAKVCDDSVSFDTSGIMISLMPGQNVPLIDEKILIKGNVSYLKKATCDGQFDEYMYYRSIGMDCRIKNARILNATGDYSSVGEFWRKVKESISVRLSIALPKPEASVMKTMLLGQKKEMDTDLKNLYQRNGIAHILSISGLHISIIGMGLLKLLTACGLHRKKAAVCAMVTVLSYGVMTGMSVSSRRAVVMFILLMLGTLVGRAYDMLTALSLIGTITLICNPLSIYNSGFGFSYGCVFGIGILMPSLVVKGRSMRVSSALTMLVIGLPLYYWYYYQLPIYSSLLNLLVIPLMSILVPLGILLIAGMYIYAPLAVPFKIVIVGMLRIIEKTALFFDGLSGHFYTVGRPKGVQVIIYAVAMIGIFIYRKKLKLHLKWIIVAVAALILTVRVSEPSTLTFLDVGQGDCIVATQSSGKLYIPGIDDRKTVLIDGGSSTVKDVGKYRIMPYLKYHGISKVDLVVITHPDEDHISGIRELIFEGEEEGIRIGKILMGDVSEEAKAKALTALTGEEILTEESGEEAKGEALTGESKPEMLMMPMEEGKRENSTTMAAGEHSTADNTVVINGIEVEFISRGDEFLLNKEGIRFECLNPSKGYQSEDSNEASVVLLGTLGEVSFLLTGDICGENERQIGQLIKNKYAPINIEETDFQKGVFILKCAHHGSKNSTSAEFLAATKPDIAIVSCGKNNAYGHPHAETLERLEYASNARVLRTDESGQVSIIVGKNVKVRQFKERNNDDK